MPKPEAKAEVEDPLELIGRAVAAYDAQIAELQAKRDHLAAFTQQSQAAALTVTAPAAAVPKSRGMSAEAKAKISAAAIKRWAKKRKADAAAQRETTAKTAPVKAKPAAKKAVVKKGKAVKSGALVEATAARNA